LSEPAPVPSPAKAAMVKKNVPKVLIVKMFLKLNPFGFMK
jgi:hypothetical protein